MSPATTQSSSAIVAAISILQQQLIEYDRLAAKAEPVHESPADIATEAAAYNRGARDGARLMLSRFAGWFGILGPDWLERLREAAK